MQVVRATDDTFCILVLGDFLGTGSASAEVGGVDWSPLRATPDTVLKLGGLRPRIRVTLGDDAGIEEEAEFSTLEDFHPAALFRRLSVLEPFREARETATREGPGPGMPTDDSGVGQLSADQGDGNLLDAILDVSAGPEDSPPLRTQEDLKSYVRDIVRPYVVSDDSDVARRIAAVDEVSSLHLSSLLHAETFQRLEGIWRSLVFLLSRVDTTGRVRVYLTHLPRGALEEEMETSFDPERSRLFHLLSSPDLPAPGKRWGLVVGAYGFGFSPREIHLLGRIARVARAADLPWISAMELPEEGLSPPDGRSDGGDEAWAEPPGEWMELRARPEAEWLGLTFPRFLLREPYGERPKRKKELDFREKTDSWEDLLWGHGPFLVASLMAQGFVAEGWDFTAERHLESGGMPLGAPGNEEGGRPRSVRTPLTPDGARRAMDMGVMPLLGFPARAGVRLGGFHSISGRGVGPSSWWRR
jgi:type VI secretion system protein ImpC